MPPSQQTSFDPTDHLLPPAHKSSTGAIVGIVIIITVLIIGALYFWGAHLNTQSTEDALPFILGDGSETMRQN
jgi:hypothetical protein